VWFSDAETKIKIMKNALHVIVGLGKTGFSCVRYCLRQQLPIVVMDTRPRPPLLAEFTQAYPDIPLYLGELPLSVLTQATEVIVSPGVDLHLPELQACQQQGIRLIGDVELFAREAQAPIVAITGTNAKSTVTSLVGEMAQQAGIAAKVGGNIGLPLLDLLADPASLYVVELSSFQLETTWSLAPAIASILNISDDHLDRHQTMQNYIAAKRRIYHNAKAIVYNQDDIATYPPKLILCRK
jgi:UDP-N-acetylmuramoylalanine--D-glutamate ligase